PLIAAFIVLRQVSPFGAVLIVLGSGMALAHLLGLAQALPAPTLTSFTIIAPTFDPQALIGLAVPLYLVTMASQNLPGLAVLRSDGYEPPVSAALGVTGLASLASAPFGGHTSNLAAITASICTGPDAHPDPDKRWLCGPFYAAGYAGLALVGGWVVALFASYPDALIITVAGLALTGPLVASLSAALAREPDRFAAITTFVVAASGVNAWGIGAAFWGLTAGMLVHAGEHGFRRLRGAA
ncbi:MAG: benzoate/H(+) symporter BenE family transporter, partial [Pseudomonadota bacterium]